MISRLIDIEKLAKMLEAEAGHRISHTAYHYVMNMISKMPSVVAIPFVCEVRVDERILHTIEANEMLECIIDEMAYKMSDEIKKYMVVDVSDDPATDSRKYRGMVRVVLPGKEESCCVTL